MTSKIQLINKVKAFFAGHLQVKRTESEFLEQIGNYTGQNEKFPLIFMVFNGSSPSGYLNTYDVDIYCLDIIQKDRKNINTIVSDCELILNDFYIYFTQGDDTSIDILNPPFAEDVNNQFEDYLAGSKMNCQIEVEMQSLCELPLEDPEEPNAIKVNNNAYLSGNGTNVILWQ